MPNLMPVPKISNQENGHDRSLCSLLFLHSIPERIIVQNQSLLSELFPSVSNYKTHGTIIRNSDGVMA